MAGAKEGGFNYFETRLGSGNYKNVSFLLDLSVNFTERKLSKNASLKKWLCIKISWEYLHTP
jgi:hypothetical protein